LSDGRHVVRARVFITDGSGKTFEEKFAGFVANYGDARRRRKFRWKHGGVNSWRGSFTNYMFEVDEAGSPQPNTIERSIKLQPITSFMGVNPTAAKWFIFINQFPI
jgi:hypothetical protein